MDTSNRPITGPDVDAGFAHAAALLRAGVPEEEASAQGAAKGWELAAAAAASRASPSPH